ncbi:autotransporter outer membrane beta-barrel domain-containing protein [Ereboglobus luteus]|uniref:Autotransporter domain-containing protein n=1 Tax=Ereboglobus luteus TaxID=1796921 RepID=A0A2U8E3C8_9BACT|nr:autotransporter outer membrane beta-barrel domain-containing protein [Ereboglobus luteus]AWI09379.1 hypothetical protein CKA38_09090 [Ereboglobus luteus]
MKTPDATPTMTTTRPSLLNLKFKLPFICAALVAATMPGLRSADVIWTPGVSGDWTSPVNWQGGVLPTEADSVLADSGTITVGDSVIVGVTGTSKATGTTAIGLTADKSSSLIITSGGHLVTDNKVFSVGEAGSGYLEIQSGGTLQTGGYIYGNQIGNIAGSSGTVVIKDGGVWRSYGGIYVGNNGTGLLHVEAGGTLIIDGGASLYLGERTGGSGTAIIDGYFETGKNAAGNPVYQPIGKNSTDNSVFIIGSTGTAITAQMNIGMNAGAVGTAIVSGYWQANGNNAIGNKGTGTLIVEAGGSINSSSGWMRFGSVAGSYGTGTIAGSVTIASTMTVGSSGNGDLVILPGGYVKAATFYVGENGVGSVYIAEGATLVNTANGWFGRNAGSSGTLTVDGNWLKSASGDAYNVIGNGGATAAPSVLNVGVTGTVISNDLRIGGNNTVAIVNLAGFYSGTRAGATVGHGSNSNGTLHITTTGTLLGRTVGVVANAAGSTGSAIVEGLWQVGGNFTVGNNATATGSLDIKTTANVIAGGNYTQNSLSTLSVELDRGRAADTVDPSLSRPLLSANGAAMLSGTLYVHGDAVADIPEFKYDGSGYAKASTLTGIPVLRASGGITGDFDTVKIDGMVIPSGLPDFIRGGGLKVNEGGPVDTRYDIGYGLAWRSGVGSAHGEFTVDAGKTFEVDLQLSDRELVFDSGWDGKSLIKKGEGTLIFSVENAYTGLTKIEAGTIIFTGPKSHIMGELVNHGVIDLGGTGQRLLTASSLAGSGTYRMTVNLNNGTGDRIAITGDAAGAHRFLITGIGSGEPPTGDEPMITLLSIGGVNEITHESDISISGTTFHGSFDHGVFKYAVEMRGNNLVIVNTGLDPVVFDTIRGVPGAQSLLWFDQQDNLGRRLGELRAPRDTGFGLDFWVRAHAASTTIGGGDTEMRKSDVDVWGAEIGGDYTWRFDSDRLTVGAFIGFNSADQDFQSVPYANSATGDSDLFSIGAYAAWLSDAGWFVNSSLTTSHYKNKFDAVDLSYNHATGDYKDRGFGVTVEGGRRFDITKGWFVEPALQGAVVRLIRGSYTTEGDSNAGGLRVHGADATITRMRGVMRIGRAWSFGNGQWMEIAGRGGAVRERSTGGEVNIGEANRWRPNLDGERFEAGVGFYWMPFESGQLYFDYEFASGSSYQKPWGISVGFRLSL